VEGGTPPFPKKKRKKKERKKEGKKKNTRRKCKFPVMWKEERPRKSLLAAGEMVDLEGGESSRGKGESFDRDTVKRKLFPSLYSSFLLTMVRGGIGARTLPRLCTRKFLLQQTLHYVDKETYEKHLYPTPMSHTT